jgi:tetratricopeptide (TPR) repeat protein
LINLIIPRYTSLLILVLIIVACSGQDKRDAANFFLKANAALTQHNFQEAVRLYDEAISKNPEFADAYLNKGISLLGMNKAQDARDVLTKAIELDPTLVQANLVRAETSLRLGDLKEAETDLLKIEKQYGDSSRYFLLHGNLMQARSNESAALSDFDKALVLDDKNVEALVNRGAIYYSTKSFKDAKEDFLKAVRINPAQNEALNNLGLIAIKENDLSQAMSYFNLILDANPADPLALNNKGYALLLQKDSNQAKQLIDKSLDIMPENGYALRNLGLYFQQTNQPTKALEAYNNAIDLAEPVDLLYGLTGKLYFTQKNNQKACEIWRKGVALNDSLSRVEWAKNCQ